jgi:XTP/dITP diphosphohydrolase
MTLRLVLATANSDKAAEIAAILGGEEPQQARIELVERPAGVPEVEESGATLLDNARLKAKALMHATGMAAVADDTGLEVDALGGAPGIHSARYAGPDATYADNVRKLLAELASRSDAGGERRARFTTVALVLFPDGAELWRKGSVEGSIAQRPMGDGGFGYDPIFLADGAGGRTFAQLSTAEKDELSHRGRAFRALAVALGQAPYRGGT